MLVTCMRRYKVAENVNGYAVGIDLESDNISNQFRLHVDPFDLLAIGSNRLVVSRRYGDVEHISVYRTSDGSRVGSSSNWFFGTSVLFASHPSHQFLYYVTPRFGSET